MKPLIFAVMGIGLAACVSGAVPRTVTETPASIAYECKSAVGGCQVTPQDVANSAQEHCRRFGKSAQQTRLFVAPSGNFEAAYNCV